MLTPSEKQTLHDLVNKVDRYKYFGNSQDAYDALKKLLNKLSREFVRQFFLYRISGEECEHIHRNVDIMNIVAETKEEIFLMKQCETLDYIIRRIHLLVDRELEASEIVSNFLEAADAEIYAVMKNIKSTQQKDLLDKFNNGADIITHQVHDYMGILKVLTYHEA